MLSKEDILRLTHGGLDVFRHYLGEHIQVGRKFRNPFYHDTHPSCCIYYDRRTGVFRYKDFGDEAYAGDCFDLVATVHNLSQNDSRTFVEILRIIDRELNLGLSAETTTYSPHRIKPALKKDTLPPIIPPPVNNTPTPYTLRQKLFSAEELRFWMQSGIDSNLLAHYNVVSLAEFSSVSTTTGRPYSLRSTSAEPMFGYLHKDGVKIYRPYSKSRFVHGGTQDGYYCFGLEQLPATGDVLFITGGEKDVLSLSAHHYAAICFGSESALLPEPLIKSLHDRFKRIILLYDTDATGLKCSLLRQQQLAKYGIERLVLPLSGTKQDKDITDFFRNGHTISEFESLYSSRPQIASPHIHKRHSLKK